MQRKDIEAAFNQEPFRPLRLHLAGGGIVPVPFQHVGVFQKSRIIIFKGVKKPNSHVAKSFEVINYDQIDHIEQRNDRGARRRKAS